MFNNIKELKEFISWAKEQQIKSFKIKDIEVEVSELSFLPQDELTPVKQPIGDTLVDTDIESTKEDEELMFWSSN